jgi:hypothetical protein
MPAGNMEMKVWEETKEGVKYKALECKIHMANDVYTWLIDTCGPNCHYASKSPKAKVSKVNVLHNTILV